MASGINTMKMYSVKEEQRFLDEIDLITTSLCNTMCDDDTEIKANVVEAARKYYLDIVNGVMSSHQKRTKIFQDLVIGTQHKLLQNNGIATNSKTKISIKYRIGLSNDEIKTVNSEIICIGKDKQNDIVLNHYGVSRFHCFAFSINNKLIILDGWSANGTKTIDIVSNNNDKKQKQNILDFKSSTRKHRNILQYDITDTIHLRFAKNDIIINPKQCIVCMDKARIKKNDCGHVICCNQCFKDLSNCPICRKSINHNMESNNKNNNNSAGLHTYAVSTNYNNNDKVNTKKRKRKELDNSREHNDNEPNQKRRKLNK